MEQQDKKGHRQRMRRRYIKSGFSGMSLRDIAELLLFYPISRRDTQPIAEKIQKRFSSLEAFLSADKDELLTIDGMGESAAEFIEFFSEVCEKCLENREGAGGEEAMPELLALKKTAYEYYSESYEPRLDVLLLDNDLNFVTADAVCENFSGDYGGIDTDYFRQLIRKNISYAVLLEFRNNGGYYPNKEGIAFVKGIADICKSTGVTLYDYILVNKTGTFSIYADYRFTDVLELR